jgi:hypothetical protein
VVMFLSIWHFLSIDGSPQRQRHAHDQAEMSGESGGRGDDH